MVNNRNGFTYAANIVVLAVALLMFLTVKSDIDQFRYLCFTCIGLGFFSSFFYITMIWEVPLSKACDHFDFEYKVKTMGREAAEKMEKAKLSDSMGKKSKDWRAWLSEGNFYIHGMVYMLVRIAVNVTMTVQPFYLNEVT